VVYSDCSEPLAAISISGMTSRVTDERLPMLGRLVRDVATELTLALGGVLPPAKSP
jgi:IclR family acetate operon transcriptional repressor